MKDILKKWIEAKETKVAELRSKAKASESLEEVRSLTSEIEGLNSEIAEMRSEMSKLDETPAPFNPLGTYGMKETRSAKEADEEYRMAFMDLVLKGTPIPENLRDNESTKTPDVASVIPTVLVNRIVEKMEECGMILPLVTKTAFAAGIVIPTSSVKPVATWVGEGKGSDKQKKTTGKITFSYFKLRCEVAMSMEVSVMTLAVFEQRFVDNVAKAMVKAEEEAIISGTGENGPTGILTAGVPDEEQSITTTGKNGAWTYKDLVAADSAIPAQYEAGAKWFMSKKEFGKILAMTDSNGQPIARVNYGIAGKPERSILGREVVCHPYGMGEYLAGIFDFSDYVLNTIYDMGITKRQNWDNEDKEIKAVMSVDGKVVDNGSLVLVKAGE